MRFFTVLALGVSSFPLVMGDKMVSTFASLMLTLVASIFTLHSACLGGEHYPSSRVKVASLMLLHDAH